MPRRAPAPPARSAAATTAAARVLIATLRRLARCGPLTARALRQAHAAVYLEVLRVFGGMAAARRAAGLPQPRGEDPAALAGWLAGELRRLRRAGVRLVRAELYRGGHGRVLYLADLVHGSLSRAIAVAGLAREPRKLPAARTAGWDEDAVIAEIRRRHRAGAPLAPSRAPGPLVRAGRRYLGGWRAAVEAAGLDYATLGIRQRHDDGRLLAWLRGLARRHPAWTRSELRRARGVQSVIERWGSLDVALTVAGLAGWPRRMITARLDRAAVVVELRRAAALAPDARRARHKQLRYHAVTAFGSWQAAVAAARARR